ncbi:MAG: DEAD/DEAH box helicase [Acidimicrobiales bacterium]
MSELLKQVQACKEILQKATEDLKINQDTIVTIEKEQEPLVKRIRELNQAKMEPTTKIARLRPVIRENTEKIRDLEHQLSRLEIEAMRNAEISARSQEFDTLTANMPWREWAFDHQITGAKEIALGNGRVILGDKRGLGKTLTSLIACDMLKSKKVIILAPKETIKNFEDEIREWAKHRTLVTLITKGKDRRDFVLDMLKMADEWILTVNIEAWRKDKYFINELINTQPDTIVIDEAHYIKDTDGLAFKGIEKLVHAINMCPLCGENSLVHTSTGTLTCATFSCSGAFDVFDKDVRSVKNVIPMTGTVFINSPQDMFALLNLIDDRSFPDKNEFLYRYCIRIKNRWVFRSGGEAALMKKIGSQYISRTREMAGVKIPPQKIQHYELEWDRTKYAAQWRAYQELKHDYTIFSNTDDKQMQIDAVIVFIMRARQMLSWPEGIVLRDPTTNAEVFRCDVRQSQKLDKAVSLIAEFVAEGERTVLFSQFTPPLEELERRLRKVTKPDGSFVRPVILNGNTPSAKRDLIRHDFDRRNGTNEWDVVLCHYRVGGQSLNFTAATQMIILDREWSPGKMDQAFGRIDRLGQTEETTVHVLDMVNTIDSFMAQLNDDKARMIEGFETEHSLFQRVKDAIDSGDI